MHEAVVEQDSVQDSVVQQNDDSKVTLGAAKDRLGKAMQRLEAVVGTRVQNLECQVREAEVRVAEAVQALEAGDHPVEGGASDVDSEFVSSLQLQCEQLQEERQRLASELVDRQNAHDSLRDMSMQAVELLDATIERLQVLNGDEGKE